MFSFGSIITNAQNAHVGFGYDKAGNRISRYVIYMKDASVTDSVKLEQRDLLAGVKVLIKPNPTTGALTIELKNAGTENEVDASYFLYTTGGKLIRYNEKMNATTRINIGNQGKGLYILKILINGKTRVWKVIKE